MSLASLACLTSGFTAGGVREQWWLAVSRRGRQSRPPFILTSVSVPHCHSVRQYYNTGAGRINHEHVRTAAYLDESDPNAQADQMAKVQDYESKLSDKCGDKYSETLAKSEYRPNTLASFTADDLAKIAIPEMSPPARDAKSNELANQIMGAITGFSGGYQVRL